MVTIADTGSLLMSQLVDVARREKERQAEREEEEEEEGEERSSSPTVQPPTPGESSERVGPKQPRRTNSGRLRRQQHSVRDGEEGRMGGHTAGQRSLVVLCNMEPRCSHMLLYRNGMEWVLVFMATGSY